MRVKTRRSIDGGKKCRHCDVWMQRFEHKENWQPKPNKGYYKFWDICPKCARIYQYPAAYVMPQNNDDFDLIERN